MNMQFPADLYYRYRPSYPAALFELLRNWMTELKIEAPAVVADIGCGSGQGTVGLARSGLARTIFAVEPDAETLQTARNREDLAPADVRFVERPGEDTGLAKGTADVVFSACAFHWMNREKAVGEFLRLARRPGLLFLAEYRFPISSSHPEFDQWIRDSLSGPWQIPEMRDRGTFAELVSVFGGRPGVESLGVREIPMTRLMDWRDLAGLIRTQSRYVRFRAGFADESAREVFDREVAEKVHVLLGEEPDEFDFRLQAAGFSVR